MSWMHKPVDLLIVPYDTAEYLHDTGRVSDTDWRRYQAVWVWGACHYSNTANAETLQEQFTARYGSDAFWRRIDRTRAFIRMLKRIRQERMTREQGGN